MSRQRKFAVKFGGGGNDKDHDTRLIVNYLNVFSNKDADQNYYPNWEGGKVEDYKDIFGNIQSLSTSKFYPLICNYSNDDFYNVSDFQGMVYSDVYTSRLFSIYRREYDVFVARGAKKYGQYYEDNFYDSDGNFLTPYLPNVYYVDVDTNLYYKYNNGFFNLVPVSQIYTSEWEPVVIHSNSASIYDYNIVNNKTYQYVLYEDIDPSKLDNDLFQKSIQVFANSGEDYRVWLPNTQYIGQGKLISGSAETANVLGSPVTTNWDEWSICELIPESYNDEAPLIKNVYKVNQDQIWRFRFSLETGEQKQNLGRSEFQTLGQFSKIGYGNLNYASGTVSAYMGSEIIIGTKNKYVERLGKSRISPLSTNERVKMLEQWQKFVSSKNPKLLKDIKGQSWIVQILSSGNTVKNFYNGVPDTISFEWKQIEDTKGVIIYSPTEELPNEIKSIGSLPFESIFGKNI